MDQKDIPETLQQMDETLARLKLAADDETRLALLRELAHLLTEAHSLLRLAA